jgi:hypothetical protein
LDLGPSILFFVFPPAFFFWQGFIMEIWCFITRLYNWKLQGGFLGGRVGALGLVGGVRGRPRDMLELTTLRK